MISVRAATGEDIAASQLVSQDAFDELRRVYRPKKSETTTDLALVRLVAETDGRVVGTVLYAVESNRLHLRGLAVHPSYRRTGVARAILEYLGGLATTMGLRSLSLYTIKETGNVAIFERLGFRIVREEPASWAESDCGDELVEIFMERPLSSNASVASKKSAD